MSDERAVEAGQVSQPAPIDEPQAAAGYFEPHQRAELAKYGRLYLVADSVSGAASGQVASQYAIKKILHRFYTSTTPDPETRLLEVIRQANTDIFERNNQYPERRIIATTLIAALIHGNKLFVANVGDSRVYVVWDQDIELLNRKADSSSSSSKEEEVRAVDTGAASSTPLIPAKMEPAGEQSDQSAKSTKPQALGLKETVKVDTFSRRMFAGDIVVLCSGGLTGYVTEKEIARAVTESPPELSIRRLLALAGERGNRDHLAISITRMLSSPVAMHPPVAMPLPAAPQWSDWETLPKPSKSQPTPSARSQAVKPVGPPKDKARPMALKVTQGKKRDWWRWQSCVLVLLVLIVLCSLPWLAWQYLISPEMIAAVPFLGDVEAVVLDSAESLGLDLTQEEVDSDQTMQDAQSEPTATPIPSPTPTSTLVATSNSPVATPETIFVSPVSPVATPTPSSEQAVPQTEVVSSSESTIPTPSPTPLPTIVIPPGCSNRARFVRDVTVPDGSKFAPAEKFEKVWLLLNAESCPWGPGYTVRFIGGDLMGAEKEVPLLEVVSPETNGEIRVPMIAPATGGEYRGEWQLYELTGEPFGPEMYLEIEVVPPDLSDIDDSELTTLYDFVEKADEATWSSGETTYAPLETDINETLELPAPQGMIAIGSALLRGNVTSEGNVLLTYPHRELGLIEGTYAVDIPLQPTDVLAATIGFIKLSILSDDGVTFEVIFTPADGSEQVILSRAVQYRDSPVTEMLPLSGLEPGQTGTFTLRVLGGESLNQDWAVWIDLRLIRL